MSRLRDGTRAGGFSQGRIRRWRTSVRHRERICGPGAAFPDLRAESSELRECILGFVACDSVHQTRRVRRFGRRCREGSLCTGSSGDVSIFPV